MSGSVQANLELINTTIAKFSKAGETFAYNLSLPTKALVKLHEESNTPETKAMMEDAKNVEQKESKAVAELFEAFVAAIKKAKEDMQRIGVLEQD